MTDIFEQLAAEGIQVSVGTTSQTSNGGINNVTIDCVIDGFFLADNGHIAAPMCQIVGVQGDGLLTGITLPVGPTGVDRTGECECCEQPTRAILEMIRGITATADYFTDGFFDNIQNARIVDIQEGLVKITTGQDTYILSTCHIAKIQDIRANGASQGAGLTCEPL
ncbi:hypothetical protein [Neobacillus sp. PS2-9]|uniref:hypothetical protein n=1 Tax=Neobacillus sp. PS2-9 TaxID=3070676 RepID=UPI0027DF8550|nr:hypothetical protein [Neobacillus sp. PS2-9]WML58029.1 hypothetical protein RCG25_24660 [Neobacillus sp. PS2-9]